MRAWIRAWVWAWVWLMAPRGVRLRLGRWLLRLLRLLLSVITLALPRLVVLHLFLMIFVILLRDAFELEPRLGRCVCLAEVVRCGKAFTPGALRALPNPGATVD